MTTTHTPPREVIRRATEIPGMGGAHAAPHGRPPGVAPGGAVHSHGGLGSQPHPLDPSLWQRILTTVRMQHPTLNRVWFDQMVPRQLTNGVIQVTVPTPAQLNFCQGQCQQPFNSAAQQVTGRLIVVSFHCDSLGRGGVFNE